MIFVGNDWAEEHHDVWVMDGEGQRLESCRLPEGVEGVGRLHEVVGSFTDDPSSVVIGIETDRGLWVYALVAAGYQVYAVNPLSVARYRERHTISGAKSDPGDAKVLADLVRTDRHNHRQIAADTATVEGIKVLARAHQNLVWERQRHQNMLRSSLREFYPAALTAFSGRLHHPDSLGILAEASTPAAGRALTLSEIKTALRRAGRQRNVERRAGEIQTALQADHLETDPQISQAFAAVVQAEVAVIGELNNQIDRLVTTLEAAFRKHPDAEIITSIPGLSVVLGARVLAEFGDDPNRYDSVKSRRNYAGTSPITRTSGKQHTVSARWIRNSRLGAATDQWAFSTLTRSPGARIFYDQHRTAGDTHHQALRALANRLVGIYHGCIRTHTPYNEHTAWAHRQPQPQTKAA